MMDLVDFGPLHILMRDDASAAAVAVKALNSVDLPTFGNPTIPQLKPMSYSGR